ALVRAASRLASTQIRKPGAHSLLNHARKQAVSTIVPFLVLSAAAAAQPKPLTLAEAEATALKNHPRLNSALLAARATDAITRQISAARSPTLSSNLTGVGAQADTAVAAGAVTTSSLSSRGPAAGITGNQLLFDFGRVSSLTKSSDLRAGAQRQTAQAT